MASLPDGTVSLKIFVDKKNNRVVLAEADKHFVDILISFLTLPLGAVVRILGKESTDPLQIGMLNSLYDSLEQFGTGDILTEGRKNFLLRPPCLLASLENLKISLDPREPSKYFMCSDSQCRNQDRALVSYYVNAKCSCGKLMTKNIRFDNFDLEKVGTGDVIIKGCPKFLITDDLQIVHSGLTTSVKILRDAGIMDVKQLVEQNLAIGLNDIRKLLKQSLLSKTPLSDVFLPKQGAMSSNGNFSTDVEFSLPECTGRGSASAMSVKLVKRKSDGKVVQAESREDFVSFIFSFLVIPLGATVRYLGGFEFGCLDKLSESVSDLSSEWFVNYHPIQNLLVPKFCRSELLDIYEDFSVCYYYLRPKLAGHFSDRFFFSSVYWHKQCDPSFSLYFVLMDPRTSDGGYFQGPAEFTISDESKVTPVSTFSISSLLSTLDNISTDDFEECWISVGPKEALQLFRLALISKRSMIDVLDALPKKAK